MSTADSKSRVINMPMSMISWAQGPKSSEDASRKEICSVCNQLFEEGDYTVWAGFQDGLYVCLQDREVHINCENPKKSSLAVEIQYTND